VSIQDELRSAVADQGFRRIGRLTGRYACAVEQWETEPVNPFFNVDTPEDLTEVDRLVAIIPGL
jgi:molybdenum cofactor guanylyltransferase